VEHVGSQATDEQVAAIAAGERVIAGATYKDVGTWPLPWSTSLPLI
jgi:hypothetical protein